MLRRGNRSKGFAFPARTSSGNAQIVMYHKTRLTLEIKALKSLAERIWILR